MTPTDERKWRDLVAMCLADARLDAIRKHAKAMRGVQMPRSEWERHDGPFPKLRAAGCLAMVQERPRLKLLAEQCRAILDGIEVVAPPPIETGEVEAPAQDGRPSRRYRRDIDD